MTKALPAWLQRLGVERPRYMLVDVATGKDMREAREAEVEHVRRTANFSGTALLGSQAVTIRKIGGCP